jgi:hypothetical protein
MKLVFLCFVLAGLALRASAQESAYQAALKPIRTRVHLLEAERDDYRKVKPGLSPAQEEEYLRLIGRLFVDDPIWVILQELQADIHALGELPQRTSADGRTLEKLKDLLAMTSGFEERAIDRKQAEEFATTLRQFIARRDGDGAHEWSKKALIPQKARD